MELPKLTGLSLFSGIGGDTLGLSPYVNTIGYCEKNKFCRSVLLERMQEEAINPGPIWEDVRRLDGKQFRGIDIVYGGSPCQQLSNNNPLGKGLAGKESSLFYEFTRVISEAKPRFVFLENVQGLISKSLPEVTLEFSKLGYDCEWLLLPASKVGAPHLRRRFFLYAVSNSNRYGCDSRISDLGEGYLLSEEACLEKEEFQRDRGESKFRETSSASRPTNRKIDVSTYTWEAEPNLARVVHGFPNQLDAIKALGNAVVPMQARLAFEILSGLRLPA